MKHILIILLFFISVFSVHAETIILKSGKSLDGKIIKQSSDSVRVSSGNKEFEIPKRQIYKIRFNITQAEKKQLETQAVQLAKKEKESKNKDDLQKEEANRLLELEKELAQFVKPEIKTSEDLVKKVHELESRLSELEKFTEIHSDWKDYYKRKRSPWDLVWRSAILPGWGLVYAKEGYIGKSYTFLTLFAFAAAIGLDSAEKSQQRSLNAKIIEDFVINPVIYANISSGSSSSALTSIITFQNLKAITNYTKSSAELNDISKLKNSTFTLATGLYLFQLLHSGLKGYFWSKELTQTASGEIVTEGINIQITPPLQTFARLTESKSEIKYIILF